jgi:hypothetical protein
VLNRREVIVVLDLGAGSTLYLIEVLVEQHRTEQQNQGGCRSGAGGATDQGYGNTSLSIKSCIFHFFVHLYSCDYFMIYILIYCCLFNFPLVHPINAIFCINLVAFFQYFKAKKQVDLHKEFDEHLASGALIIV